MLRSSRNEATDYPFGRESTIKTNQTMPKTPENQYTISEKAKDLLLGLLQNHKEYLEKESETFDDNELELTDSLIDLFEDD